jgi:site-specific DNA-methyltransferase (adenine-specific)
MIDVTKSAIYNESCLDFIPKLPDSSVDALITDPPYGVGFWSRRAITGEGKKWVKKVENDSDLDGALALFADVLETVKPKLKDDADVYVFTRWDIVPEWIGLIREVPWLSYKMLLVWDKGIPGMGDIDSNWGCGHELVLYCKREVRREVAYRRSGIIAVDKVHPAQAIHPTEKPVPLLERFVEMSTKPGQVVFDPFSGSGSTAVAAKNQGRVGIATEIDPEHYQRSVGRLAQGALF